MSSSTQLPSACSTAREQVLATVLQLVLQHANVKLYEVTRWMQLSTSIRKALQQASGNLAYDSFKLNTEKLTALASWLPGHAGLVSTLALSHPNGAKLDSPEWGAVEQMLSLALQLSSSSRFARSSTTSHGPPLPALQLREFSTDFVFQPAALKGLASSSCLTQLSLNDVPAQRFTAELCTALGSLRGLRSLFCCLQGPALNQLGRFPPEFAAAVAGLTQLEGLAAYGFVPATDLTALPASLIHLSIHIQHPKGPAAVAAAEAAAAGSGRARLQMGHLTRLQSLDLLSVSGINAQSQLPAHLTALRLVGCCEAVHDLPELQWLQLPRVGVALPMLQTAAQQPKLQDLELGLHGANQQQLQQVADALGRCTQLTELHLYPKYNGSLGSRIIDYGPECSIDLAGMRLQLQGLRQLQRLRLTQIKWDLKGFSQLTVLSSLTQLVLIECDIADTGLAVVFQRLTRLRALQMTASLPDNECLLVALAGLTNLHSLALIQQQHKFTDDTLPLLSPLTKLTFLSLCCHHADEGEEQAEDPVSAEVEGEFLAGMPSLNQIGWL